MIEIIKSLNKFIVENYGFKFYFDIFSAVIGVFNIIFVILVFKLTQKDINPKLSIIPDRADAKNMFDKYLNIEALNINFKQKGFSELGHDSQLWKLIIRNDGDLPATCIKMNYSIIIKKADFDYGIDKADVINVKFVDFKTINRVFEMPYLPAKSKVEENILYLRGEFVQADLLVNTLKTSERCFIKKSIKIDEYKHPDLDHIEDSYHFRKIIGASGKYE